MNPEAVLLLNCGNPGSPEDLGTGWSVSESGLRQSQCDLLANGAVSTGIVIGSIFLACDELLQVEELTVGASENFINDCGFQANHTVLGMCLLDSTCPTKEGVE